jgi:hypothetical protein
MQVPRFSPRISLIEMAPRAAPHSGCPGRPALPLPSLSPAPQGTGSDWKNLPGTAQFLSTQTDGRTDTMFAFIYKIGTCGCVALWKLLRVDHGRICILCFAKFVWFDDEVICIPWVFGYDNSIIMISFFLEGCFVEFKFTCDGNAYLPCVKN